MNGGSSHELSTSGRAADSRRRVLSREKILAAALELIDAPGLTALSMRRLGQERGVAAMSL